jgi:hypothetical protein
LEGAAELGDAGADGGTDALSTRRWTNTAASSLKERIAEGGAQAGEGVAHGGLAESDAAGGAADVAFFVESVKGEKEVEVKRLDIHIVNIISPNDP